MGKYSQEALEAYNDIREDGGAITIYPSTADSAPADPERPWLGGDTQTEGHKTFALFVASESDTVGINFTQLVYIPGYNIPFSLTSENTLKDIAEKIWSIDEIIPLTVSGEEVILYIGKVSLWQQR